VECLGRRIRGEAGSPAQKLYLKYHCSGIEVGLFGQALPKSSFFRPWILALNATVACLFALFLSLWSRNERAAFRSYLSRTPLPSDFALKLRNLPQSLTAEELKRALLVHFRDHHTDEHTREMLGQPLVEVSLAKNNALLDIQEKILRSEQKVKDATRQLIDLGVFEGLPTANLHPQEVFLVAKQRPGPFRSLG